MKTKAGLPLLIGAWLFTASATATAHDGYHRDSASRDYHDVYYDVRVRRSHAMPRWLARDREFRHWYRQTRYQYNRRLGWEGLWDIYRFERRFERRYGRRHELRVDLHDRPRRGKGKHKHRRH